MLRVDSPTDRTLVHPASNCFDLCWRNSKTALHRRCFQNCKNFACRETPRQNFQDAKICVDDSATGAYFPVSNRVRNFVLRIFRHAEYRIDKRRVHGNVWHHYDDVFRLQRRMMLKEIEQMIVQNLELAYDAMAGMNWQGAIAGRDGSLDFGR